MMQRTGGGWCRIPPMKIRPARIADAPAICGIINYYAERGRMLHRSLESVYASMRDFQVAQNDRDQLVGCIAVAVFWSDLAEIKSLAVSPDRRGSGVGGKLVRAAVRDARKIGVRRLFALTYEKEFFERMGMKVIDRDTLPEKVWRECFACPRVDRCDEIAMVMDLSKSSLAARRVRSKKSRPTARRARSRK